MSGRRRGGEDSVRAGDQEAGVNLVRGAVGKETITSVKQKCIRSW